MSLMRSRLPAPRKVSLARAATPLQPLPRTSEALGVEVLFKRDDLTGSDLSGNKVRKLEYLLAEAQDHNADVVVTCGGEQSNHCRATALAAARLGLGSVVILRTDDPAHPPATTGNILLDRLAGAEIRWISGPDWARRDELLAAEADRLREAGRVPYVIPEGGSNALGAWGYVAAAQEIADDLATLPLRPTTIVYACGSGGTGAGLILGAKLADLAALGVQVAGVNVCDDRNYFVRAIGRICTDFVERWPVGVTVTADDIELVDGHVGRGYALSQPEELATIRDLARRDGVILDPVYTGKAFHGVVTELARARARFGERIVFVHTGGLFGLFGGRAAAEMAAVL